MPVAAAALAVLAARGHRRSVIRLALATGTSWRQAQGPRRSSRLSGQPWLGWHRPETGREALAQLHRRLFIRKAEPLPAVARASGTVVYGVLAAGKSGPGAVRAADRRDHHLPPTPGSSFPGSTPRRRWPNGRRPAVSGRIHLRFPTGAAVIALDDTLCVSSFPPREGHASSMYKLLPATGGALHHVFCCMLGAA